MEEGAAPRETGRQGHKNHPTIDAVQHNGSAVTLRLIIRETFISKVKWEARTEETTAQQRSCLYCIVTVHGDCRLVRFALDRSVPLSVLPFYSILFITVHTVGSFCRLLSRQAVLTRGVKAGSFSMSAC